MVTKEEFYYDSRDGKHKLHAIRWIPESSKPVCIVQIIHGMAEYIDRYDEFARFLAGKGILVVGDDHLGHGKSVQIGEPYGYFCKEDAATVLVRDEHRLKKLTQELYPGVPYIIFGHSMGAFIARNYLLRYGTGIQGAVICGTGMKTKATLAAGKAVAALQRLFCGDQHVSRLLDKLAFGAYNKRVKNPETSFDWISRNRENVQRYMADPLCGFTFTVNGFRTMFDLIGNLLEQEELARMPKELPVFFIAGEADPVGDYGESVKKVCQSFQELGMEKVQLKLYPEERHEILNEEARQEIYMDVYRWILQRIA